MLTPTFDPCFRTKDWTKFVTLNPPNAIAFLVDKREDDKFVSLIQIFNKSSENIIYKVR